MKVALFSGFPQELTYIIKKFRAKKVRNSPFAIWSALAASKEIIIVLSGMGTINSEAAWNYVNEEYRPDYIISAGFGGALYEGAGLGDLIAASSVLLYPDAAEASPAHRHQSYLEVPGAKHVMRRMKCADIVHEGNILTLRQRVDKTELEKGLLEGLSFPVCDMETFPLAKLSLLADLPFFAVRAITDRFHEEIPKELFGVTDANGNYSLSRALRIILGNPALIPSSIRMGKNAQTASRKLCKAAEELIRIL
jgi:nucleoside phosphorylase